MTPSALTCRPHPSAVRNVKNPIAERVPIAELQLFSHSGARSEGDGAEPPSAAIERYAWAIVSASGSPSQSENLARHGTQKVVRLGFSCVQNVGFRVLDPI